jgi:uncharacterized protein YbaR (Trm112 family)
VALDPQLLEILACPDTHHAPLDYDVAAQTLTCTQCRRVFEVRDDIPVLLLDEARAPEVSGRGSDQGSGQGLDEGEAR